MSRNLSRLTSAAHLLVVALILAATSPTDARAQTTVPDSIVARAATLFGNITGHWSCTGGFARGAPLAADLTFTPVADRRAITFLHADRAPNVYWQSATWSLDANGRIVSMAMAGSTKNHIGAPALFMGANWSDRSVTLVADTVKSPPFAPNQFTYLLLSPDSLKMRWELARNGTNVVGDSLLCGRSR